MPLGVILADQRFCEIKVNIKSEKQSALSILNQMVSQLDGYKWAIEDGVVVIEPKDITKAASEFLRLVVPRYASPEGKIEAQNMYLWMDVRAILRPSEGTALHILSSGADVTLPPIDVKNESIRKNLNRLVLRPPGGAWVLSPIVNEITTLKRMPTFVMSYADEKRDSYDVDCTPAN